MVAGPSPLDGWFLPHVFLCDALQSLGPRRRQEIGKLSESETPGEEKEQRSSEKERVMEERHGREESLLPLLGLQEHLWRFC